MYFEGLSNATFTRVSITDTAADTPCPGCQTEPRASRST